MWQSMANGKHSLSSGLRSHQERLRRRRTRKGPIPSTCRVQGRSGTRRNAQRPRSGRVRREYARERMTGIMSGFGASRLGIPGVGGEQLLQPDVDHQPEPEGLEEVEDEAGLAVEDPQQEKIPVEEVERRPDEERHSVIAVFQPKDPLVRSAEEPWRRLPGKEASPAFVLFLGEGLSIVEMLLQGGEDEILLAVPLVERRTQAADRAANVDPGVLLHRAAPGAAREEAQGAGAKDLPLAFVEVVSPRLGAGQESLDLRPQLGGHGLVGLQDQ